MDGKGGAVAWARTRDKSRMRRLLYQLSYGGDVLGVVTGGAYAASPVSIYVVD